MPDRLTISFNYLTLSLRPLLVFSTAAAAITIAFKHLAFFFLLPCLIGLLFLSCQQEKPSLTLSFTGDLLLDRGVREQIEQRSIASLFEPIRPVLLQSDFVIANLECPVTKRQAPVLKKYIFRAEPAWLPEVKKAGITHLGMANNHTYDQGRAGITDTYQNVTQAGLVAIGYGMNQQQACEPVLVEKNGIRVALFTSVLLPLENWPYLPDSAGICQATVTELAKSIKAYHTQKPTNKIVVILHWGVEFQPSPGIIQRKEAKSLIDAGADAIIGHHPHVVQPLSYYKDKPIFYSLGNFVFDQKPLPTRQALIAQLKFTDQQMEVSSIPIEIRHCEPVAK